MLKTKPKKKQNCAAGSQKALVSSFKASNDNEMSCQRQNNDDDGVANVKRKKPLSQKRPVSLATRETNKLPGKFATVESRTEDYIGYACVSLRLVVIHRCL